MWESAGQLAVIVVGLLGGAATVPFVRWLKEQFGTSGAQTLALAAGVAALLTAATAVVEGVIEPGAVTQGNFGVVFLTLFVAGQVRYRQLRDELDEVT